MVETTAELIQRRDAEGVSGLAQWFALRTAPRHEKRVHERLCGQGVESFLPRQGAAVEIDAAVATV